MISTNNTILSSLNKDELLSLFREINNMSLRYRDFLNLPDYVTFGNEIEVNNIPLHISLFLVELFNDVAQLEGKDRYAIHQEETASTEVVTSILTNTTTNWENFHEIYLRLYDTGATIGGNTSSHVHIGAHPINTPEKLSLLLKTLVVFEPIIFKFGYGNYSNPRLYLRANENRVIFSPMMTPQRVCRFTDTLDRFDYNNFDKMRKAFDEFIAPELKFRPVFNFKDFNFDKFQYGDAEVGLPSEDDHFEVRCFNGTLFPAISQNNINLITKILVAVVEGNIDKEYILEEYKKYKKKRYNFDRFCCILHSEKERIQYNRLLDGFNKVKLEKALKLADMIFDNDLDKCYFLKQYLKLFKASDEYVHSLIK